MVTVTGYSVRTNKEGNEFIALELTGSLELIQSQATGNFYATVKKCSIPSTFNEDIAKLMVGTRMEGEIVRVSCEPYDYTVKRTGEKISLAYSYAYRPAGSKELLGTGHVEVEQEAEAAPAKTSSYVKPNSNAIKQRAMEKLADMKGK